MEMDIQALIGSLGFPIVAYLLMVFKHDKTINELKEVISQNNALLQMLIKGKDVE